MHAGFVGKRKHACRARLIVDALFNFAKVCALGTAPFVLFLFSFFGRRALTARFVGFYGRLSSPGYGRRDRCCRSPLSAVEPGFPCCTAPSKSQQSMMSAEIFPHGAPLRYRVFVFARDHYSLSVCCSPESKQAAAELYDMSRPFFR